MTLLFAALIALATPSPAPTSTPHRWLCFSDAFDRDLGPPAPCIPLEPFVRFCAAHHAGDFVTYIVAAQPVISCRKADFVQTPTGWKRYDHYE